jgi:hypothetical protein
MKTLEINGIGEVVIKRTMRGMMNFEIMAKKKLSEISDSIDDVLKFQYCMISACNRDKFKDINFDAWLDIIDNTEGLFEEVSTAITEATTEDSKKKVKGKK